MASARNLLLALRATVVVALFAATSIAAFAAPASAAQLVDLRFDDTTPGVLVVEWTLDDAARSTLLWGTDKTYGRAAVKSTPATSHRVEIAEVECGTTYHFAVVMVGTDSIATNSAGHTHVMPDCASDGGDRTDPAPAGGQPEVEVGRDFATITWRSATPGFGSVVYGLDLPYDSVESEPGELAVEVHQVRLEGLQCSTSYHFAAITRTLEDAFEASGDYMLTTTACEAFISDLGVDVGRSSATLSWTTAAVAESWVSIDAERTSSSSAGTAHRVDLADLNCATSYGYTIWAKDLLGAELSASGEFSTTACGQPDPIPGLPGHDDTPTNAAPAIGGVEVEQGETSLAVSWSTDVVTGGQLAWAFKRNPAEDEPAWTVLGSPDAGVDHRVDIFELECDTTYSLRIEATSAAGAKTETILDAGTLTCGSGIEIDPPTTVDPVGPDEPSTPPLRFVHEQLADVSKNSATLIWVTDLPGTGVVRFDDVDAAEDGLDRQVVSLVPGVSQRLVLNDLACGTSYLYSIWAISDAGVATEGQPGEFATNNCEAADLIDIDVRPSDTAVVVAWKTDLSADSMVIFGTDPTYGAAVYSPAMTTDHRMVLNGLRCDTNYHLRVMSNSGSGPATFSADISTTTQPCEPDPVDPGPGPTDPGPDPTGPGPDPTDPGPDPTDPGPGPDPTDPGPDPTDPGPGPDPDPTDPGPDGPGPATPLALTDVEASAGTQTATVSWITDKSSTGVVEYGLSTAYGSRAESTDRTRRHDVTLTGLRCSTTYHLRVFARAVDGSSAVSDDVSFRTENCPDDRLRIVGVNAASDPDRAVVLVTTSIEASVRVRWGAGSSLTNAIGPTQPALVHSIELENLACGTTYGYQVEATTADRFANTTRLEFTTAQCRANG